MDNKTQKTHNRQPGLSIYLGPEPERARRLAALKALADQLNISTSEMFRMLADGRLMLVVAPQ